MDMVGIIVASEWITHIYRDYTTSADYSEHYRVKTGTLYGQINDRPLFNIVGLYGSAWTHCAMCPPAT